MPSGTFLAEKKSGLWLAEIYVITVRWDRRLHYLKIVYRIFWVKEGSYAKKRTFLVG